MADIALSRSQRFQLDALGYVVLRGVLSSDEVSAMKEALYRMKSEPDLGKHRIYTHKRGEHFQLFGNLVEYDPALLGYAAHARLVPLVEELVGGAVRLEETEAIINRRRPDIDVEEARRHRSVPTGFHTGTRHGWGTYFEQDRFHCIFVKTLAYLTDVGEEDGGTAVIPGSHKMSWGQQEMIEAAQEDESLIHQVTAQAGDVLLFPESLIHSTTEILSEKERVILVSGYTPTMLRPWMGNEVRAEFIETLPDTIRPLISGEANWNWRRNYPL